MGGIEVTMSRNLDEIEDDIATKQAELAGVRLQRTQAIPAVAKTDDSFRSTSKSDIDPSRLLFLEKEEERLNREIHLLQQKANELSAPENARSQPWQR
jgi:hypothetical protein